MAKLTWAAPSSEWRELWPDTHSTSGCGSLRGEPDAVAVNHRANDVELTFGELDDLASRVAAGFVVRGIDQGNVVAAQLPNFGSSWSSPAPRPGGMRSSARCRRPTAMPSSSTCFERPRPRWSWSRLRTRGEDYVAMAGRVAAQVGTVRSVIGVGTPSTPDVEVFEDLLGEERFPATPSSPTIRLSCRTSGTEAVPKGIVHTHNTANFPLGVCSDLWGAGPTTRCWSRRRWATEQAFSGATVRRCMSESPRCSSTSGAAQRLPHSVRSEGCTYTFAPTRFLQDLLAEAAHPGSDPIRCACSSRVVHRSLVFWSSRPLVNSSGCRSSRSTARPMFHRDRAGPARPDRRRSVPVTGRQFPGPRPDREPGWKRCPEWRPGECITRGPHLAGGYLEELPRDSRASDRTVAGRRPVRHG